MALLYSRPRPLRRLPRDLAAPNTTKNDPVRKTVSMDAACRWGFTAWPWSCQLHIKNNNLGAILLRGQRYALGFGLANRA
jgi:hypothetical protein